MNPPAAIEMSATQECYFPKVFHLATSCPVVSSHIRITINGVNVSALIDTGSSITLAAQGLCPALGIFHLDTPHTDSALGMAGTLVLMAGSKQVRVKVGNIELHSVVHFTKGPCVPNMDSDYEVILGNDILAQLPPLTIDYKAKTYPVRVKDTVHIQPNAECFVSCMTPTVPPGKDLVLISQCSKQGPHSSSCPY
ncbi:hypothetical protein ANCDUO_00986 [Ancylostoma duodenale]|uniref:Peptidase A2 domain-containing protein n=1 Tax=Ancylostoma duodenale TaxID=51022 RepID=A0A0C2E022_9BILA|nr:hypothetical protein ANCDUO_00986 [Ancylostoma duodenale]